jgi:hypothetical protein
MVRLYSYRNKSIFSSITSQIIERIRYGMARGQVKVERGIHGRGNRSVPWDGGDGTVLRWRGWRRSREPGVGIGEAIINLVLVIMGLNCSWALRWASLLQSTHAYKQRFFSGPFFKTVEK